MQNGNMWNIFKGTRFFLIYINVYTTTERSGNNGSWLFSPKIKHESKKYLCFHVYCSFIYESRAENILRDPQLRNGHGRCGTHTHDGIFFDEILLFATTWVDLEGIMLGEISPMVKDKYRMIYLMWHIGKNRQQPEKWLKSTCFAYRRYRFDPQWHHMVPETMLGVISQPRSPWSIPLGIVSNKYQH